MRQPSHPVAHSNTVQRYLVEENLKKFFFSLPQISSAGYFRLSGCYNCIFFFGNVKSGYEYSVITAQERARQVTTGIEQGLNRDCKGSPFQNLGGAKWEFVGYGPEQ